MKRLIILQLALAGCAAVSGLCGGAALAADATKGKQTYIRVGCFECHGHVGQGGAAGLKLAPDPLPFDALANFVRTTSGQMPRYSTKILSDDDLADIYAYLQSIPKPPDPKNIPALSP
ncbi:MAG: cytochrome c [Xanthobacteraceae bacterium]|jgi:ubiquinol-cytochrome c reductase cytochrome c subunit